VLRLHNYSLTYSNLYRDLRARAQINRDDLLGFSEEHSIRKEKGGSRADIGIDRNIGIELKHNLKLKNEVNRLFGQIDDQLKEYNEIIIVLCGKTSLEHLDLLREKVREMPPRDMFSETRVEIVVKDGKKSKKDQFPLF